MGPDRKRYRIGESDCPAEEFRRALRKTKKDDESHGYSHLDNKVKLDTNIEAFHAKYMPPGATAPTPVPKR